MSVQVCYCGPQAKGDRLGRALIAPKNKSRSALINLSDDRALPAHGSASDALSAAAAMIGSS